MAQRSTLPARLLSITAAAVLAGTLSAAPVAATPAAAAVTSAATTGFRFTDIPGAGVTLKANVIAPATAGRHPAVVLPASWGLNDLEYLAPAKALAERGYVVVSYTPRGWWLSGGEIDTAGPNDLADLSEVIDWTIANTAADPARIGAAGVSYGAGISLIGSGTDRRIRAVAALSGWTDLVYSLYGDQTRHKQSAGLLQTAAGLLGNVGPDLQDKLADFNANRDVPEVMAWAKVRGAANHLNAINANRPAVLMANAWGDTFFPPNQLVDFYDRLAGPKRLELRPGDHAIAELTGILGIENEVWSNVFAWFDEHLAGRGPGLGGGVFLRPHNAAPEQYAAWPAGAVRRYGLGRIRVLDRTGLLGGDPSAGWSKPLPTDLDTTANGGVVLLTNGLAAFTGQQPKIWLPTVDRDRAGVWAAERPASAQRIRGVPRLRLNLSGTAGQGTVVAYLYDLDRLGNAKLITHAPASWTDGTSGSRTIDLALSATAYDLPAGHSLTLVVDTADPLYYDENAPRGTITVTGGSYLDVPLR